MSPAASALVSADFVWRHCEAAALPSESERRRRIRIIRIRIRIRIRIIRIIKEERKGNRNGER